MVCRTAALPEKCNADDSASFALILHLLTDLENESILTACYAIRKSIFSI